MWNVTVTVNIVLEGIIAPSQEEAEAIAREIVDIDLAGTDFVDYYEITTTEAERVA